MKQMKLRTDGRSTWKNSTEVKMEKCMTIRDWRRKRRLKGERRILAQRCWERR